MALVFHFIRLSNTYKARGRGDAQQLPVYGIKVY